MSIAIARSDIQIRSDVLDELRWDAAVDEADVRVHVRDAIVTLTGNVGSLPGKRAARDAANRVLGVRGIVDDMTVRHPRTRALADEKTVPGACRLIWVRGVVERSAGAAPRVDSGELERLIEAALERRAEREARRLGLAVQDGVVTITGTLRSWGEKNAIERVAAHAPGIRRVDDRTTVDPDW
jgi:osmotically-inducible protein OsmY